MKNKLLFLSITFYSLPIIVCAQQIFSWKTTPPETVKIYEAVMLDFELDANINNPYNSEEIRVDLEVKGPGNIRYVIPAFYFQSFQGSGTEKNLTPGESHWQARFMPEKTGNHRYCFHIFMKNKVMTTDVFSLSVKEAESKGFVRNSNGNYFVFDNGEPFFANSFNLAHPGDQPLDYEYFFKKWFANGMNYTRLWLAPPWGPYSFALEWTDEQYPTQKGNLGLHRINQEVAWRLDGFVTSAENYGIYLMLCFGDERELETGMHHGEPLSEGRSFWHDNPYNATNGGPANSPLEFFTNQEAKKIYKDRLRYIVARWGYSTHVLAWEFWNEIDHDKWAQDWEFVKGPVASWHEGMGRYIREVDAYDHFITSSFCTDNNRPLIWNKDVIGFVQGHSYGGRDNMAIEALLMTNALMPEYPFKPFFISEYGTSGWGYTEEGNAEEIAIHNTIWATALSGATGTAMWWWWNSIDENNLYHHYRHLDQFVKEIPWLDTKKIKIETTNERVLAIGLSDLKQAAWLWVHNTDHNWKNAKEGNPVNGLKNITVSMHWIENGKYTIQEFDTYQGKIIGEQQVEAKGILRIQIRKLDSDKAFIIKKINNN